LFLQIEYCSKLYRTQVSHSFPFLIPENNFIWSSTGSKKPHGSKNSDIFPTIQLWVNCTLVNNFSASTIVFTDSGRQMFLPWENVHLGSCPLGNFTSGKLPLGKMSLGKLPLGKCIWESTQHLFVGTTELKDCFWEPPYQEIFWGAL